MAVERALLTPLTWLVLALLGCSPNAESAKPGPNKDDSQPPREAGPAVSPSDAATDASTGPKEAAADASADAGREIPIRIGLNPVLSDDATLSDLDVVAFGSGVTTVTRRWGTTTPLQDDLLRAQWFADRGVAVIFAVDALPGAMSAQDVDLNERRSWALDTLDGVLDAQAPVNAIVLGEALDLALDSLDDEAREQLADWVAAWIREGNEHVQRSEGTLIGINTRATAWLEPSAELKTWAKELQLAALTWHGLAQDGVALPTIDAVAELSNSLLAADALLPQVWLREISFPSSASVESRESRPAAVFEALWELLSKQPELVPFVAVSSLYDPPEAECNALPQTYGLPIRAAKGYCSIGLKEPSGKLRPAFAAVFTGLASFAP